jgi:hypothetical protein
MFYGVYVDSGASKDRAAECGQKLHERLHSFFL